MDNNELYHYGTKYHSGRYPYGSGEDPYQHDGGFLGAYKEYKDLGMTETEIAKAFGMSTTELRERRSLELAEYKTNEYSEIMKLKNAGYSNVAIAEKLNISEGKVRNVLKAPEAEKARKTAVTADIIKECALNSDGLIDIGPGSNTMLGVSPTKMNTAIRALEDQGYNVYYLKVPQAGIPGQFTTIKVLAKPGMDYKEAYANRDKIVPPMENLNQAALKSANGDMEITKLGIKPPTSVDSSRVYVVYESPKDGVIELRRGVDELSLGDAAYAQVRIAVDGTHYMKGMAVYSDDIPEGYDIIYNSHRKQGAALKDPTYAGEETVFKKMKDDPDNPFKTTLRMEDGVIVGQRYYIDKNGKEVLSPVNIVKEEGDVDDWSTKLASQFLSKQPIALINKQLDKSYKDKKDEYDEIMALTNPEIKRKLLDEFASDCDASSAHLKAAALPRQSSKLILPLTDIKETEVFAPTYENGEEVILIRYPHGGTFEIPKLIVNNTNKSGQKTIGKKAIDAIGINPKVASKLSGADFDGDTVVVIPTKGNKFKVDKSLKALENFDPQIEYGPDSYKGKKIKEMTKRNTQTEMGKISNLITDMTLKGATVDEISRAVKHSMVVIDAEKHHLDYKQSEKDNDIAGLKEKYQGAKNAGASTLISQANASEHIPVRVEKNPTLRTKADNALIKSLEKKGIDNLTKAEKRDYNKALNRLTESEYEDYKQGKKIYRETGETYVDKKGKTVIRTKEVPRMSLVDDAYELSSGTPKENAYADYANKLKALANSARKEERSLQNSKYSPSAKETYAYEVSSLNAKLNNAKKNKPFERKAQAVADVVIKQKMNANPDMGKDEIKKLKTQAIAEARRRTGASKTLIDITPKEWEAISAGAISSTKLTEILDNSNIDIVKQYATPRVTKSLTAGQEAKIKSLANSGYTLAEIAKSVGVSTSTVSDVIN